MFNDTAITVNEGGGESADYGLFSGEESPENPLRILARFCFLQTSFAWEAMNFSLNV